MTCRCGLHKTKQVQYSIFDFGPRSNLEIHFSALKKAINY